MAREAVWVEGQDKLFVNMDGLTADVEKAAHRGLQRAGMRIIADAQRNMRTAGHNGATLNATGQLSNSGKVQDGENGTIDVGFFSTTSGTGYAAAVEYGTKAHWPPRWALRAWVRKKLRVPENEADAAAARVSWGIFKRGTRPHPFFAPAVEKNHNEISKAVTDAVNEVTGRNK